MHFPFSSLLFFFLSFLFYPSLLYSLFLYPSLLFSILFYFFLSFPFPFLSNHLFLIHSSLTPLNAIGTFHMWEQLNVPIVPLIFYGAYELYPSSSWVNNTGTCCTHEVHTMSLFKSFILSFYSVIDVFFITSRRRDSNNK